MLGCDAHTVVPVGGSVQIGSLFNAIGNLKHTAILFAAYSAGLRMSEVVHLKISDEAVAACNC